MPPKKGTKAKATPAKAAAAAEPPATVTNRKGKEFEATAAAGRPRRETAVTAPDTPAPKVKKATAKTTKATPAKAPAKKTATAASTTTSTTTGKKRGRPAKTAEDDAPEPPKKRGRPTKDAPAVPLNEDNAPPKKRGRPPKGGETTKIEADDDAAAEQLEEELVDEAEGATDGPSKQAPSPKKRGRPAKGKGKGKAVAAAVVEEDDEVNDDEQAEAAGVPGTNYWLMKAEQEGREEILENGETYNPTFTIDMLRDKAGPEPWDGVRNPSACKNMKDMNVGDLAFFYASGEGKGKKPGIVGIMEVVSEAEPDLTAFEEGHHGHVKNPKMRGTEAKPRWFMVHVEFRKKLSAPVTRAELQKYTTGDGVLAKMQEFNTARLSVSKVSEDEWDFIVNNLVDGYADEDEGEAAGVTKSNGDVAMADGEDFMDDNLVNGTSAPPEIKETIESEPPTTDSLLAADTAATSSRPPSRGGSKKPASLAGSLAPPAGSRTGSRARSRTPVSRRGSVQPPAPAGEAMGTIEE